MRIAILSDIHANLEALRATFDRVAADRADRIVCLGDIVGYNADPEPCIGLLREANALCVAGNHDRAVTGQITTGGFSPVAARAVEWTRGRLGPEALSYLAGLPLQAELDTHLVLVHGALHPDTGRELVRLDTEGRRRLSARALEKHPSGARICAFGHTHRAGFYEWADDRLRDLPCGEVPLRDDAHYLVNPGSVGEPRGYDRRASYALLDTGARTIVIRRVRYDLSAAMAKTRKAGLAPRFSRIPAPIRCCIRQGMRRLGLYEVTKTLIRPWREWAGPSRSDPSRSDPSRSDPAPPS